MIAASLLFLSLLSVVIGRPTHGQPAQPRFPSIFQQRLPNTISMVIALPPSNTSGLHASLFHVSDPTSPNYRNHLSKAQVEQFVAPRPESVTTVKNWLAKFGVTAESASPAGDILRANVSVETANKLLNASYTPSVHAGTNIPVLLTDSYSVPPEVQQHLAFIYPTTQFIPPPLRHSSFQVVRMNTQSRRVDIPADCAQQVVPSCLQAIYNIPSTPASASGNTLAVSGFINEVANPDDLKTFLAKLRPDITNGTFNVQSVDGGADDGQGTLEASLDIQYTVGLATNVPTTFVSVGSQNQDGVSGFLDIINNLLHEDSPPLVLTTSFGADEPAFEQDPAIAQTLCNAYAQLGARGTSILFSSGDGGVGGSRPTDSCPNGFIPTFPSGCPFITTVGSTQGINPEVGAPFSAGGFSNIFPRPSYQDTAVQTYLASLGSTNAGLFNASGRAYPDVSTQGKNFLVDVAGQGQLVFGTSASSPTFASIVALVNDQLLNAGQKPLGFLNPLLYSQATAAFTDITSGSNPSCGTDGFPALAGWDAVTGLGTPDFNKLVSLVMNGTAAQE